MFDICLCYQDDGDEKESVGTDEKKVLGSETSSTHPPNPATTNTDKVWHSAFISTFRVVSDKS